MGCASLAMLGMLLLLPVEALAQQAGAEAAKPAEAAIPAEATKASEGIVHTVVAGDTLWDLSAKHLGSPWKWADIWERNRFLTNPHYIYPGVKVVIVPPGAKEITLAQEAAPAPVPAAPTLPAEELKPAAPPAAPPPSIPYLDIKPADFVRAGEFTKERPRGIGNIGGGQEPKVGFVEGDMVYLTLGKEIPEGQLLGVYRVRGPIRGAGERPVSGYVSYLVGVVQAGSKEKGRVVAKVRQSFEDLTQADLISEEIPAYASVRIVPGEDGIPSRVLAGRLENKEFSEGDFIYLDNGSSAGVAVGNVFRIFVPTGSASAAESTPATGILYEVAKSVIVRVSPGFSTAYIVGSKESFAAGVRARRGTPGE